MWIYELKLDEDEVFINLFMINYEENLLKFLNPKTWFLNPSYLMSNNFFYKKQLFVQKCHTVSDFIINLIRIILPE